MTTIKDAVDDLFNNRELAADEAIDRHYQEVFVFADRDSEGRFVRIEETTLPLEGHMTGSAGRSRWA